MFLFLSNHFSLFKTLDVMILFLNHYFFLSYFYHMKYYILLVYISISIFFAFNSSTIAKVLFLIHVTSNVFFISWLLVVVLVVVMVVYVCVLTEVSVPPGPTVVQSQRNTQRSILIINLLAY